MPGLFVTEGEYKGYKIQFDLQFKEGSDILDIEKKSSEEKKVDGNSVGNSFARGNKFTNEKIEFNLYFYFKMLPLLLVLPACPHSHIPKVAGKHQQRRRNPLIVELRT